MRRNRLKLETKVVRGGGYFWGSSPLQLDLTNLSAALPDLSMEYVGDPTRRQFLSQEREFGPRTLTLSSQGVPILTFHHHFELSARRIAERLGLSSVPVSPQEQKKSKYRILRWKK